MHVSLSQGGELPDDQAYLDGCSTVTAFKNGKFLSDIHLVREGIKINCNAGTVTTNKKGKFGGVSAWYLPNGIANIFSMHELEKLYRITYDSWKGFYVVHTPRGEVHFTRMNKDFHSSTWQGRAIRGQECSYSWLRWQGRTRMTPLMRELRSCKRCEGITKGTQSERCFVQRRLVADRP
jgi:hypothetical protein